MVVFRGVQPGYGEPNIGVAGTANKAINPSLNANSPSQLDQSLAVYRTFQIDTGNSDVLTKFNYSGNGIWFPYMSEDYVRLSLDNNDNVFRVREGMSLLGIRFRDIWIAVPGSAAVDIDVVILTDTTGNRADIE